MSGIEVMTRCLLPPYECIPRQLRKVIIFIGFGEENIRWFLYTYKSLIDSLKSRGYDLKYFPDDEQLIDSLENQPPLAVFVFDQALAEGKHQEIMRKLKRYLERYRGRVFVGFLFYLADESYFNQSVSFLVKHLHPFGRSSLSALLLSISPPNCTSPHPFPSIFDLSYCKQGGTQ